MNEIPLGKSWKIKVNFTVNENIDNVIIGLGIIDIHETSVSTSWSLPQQLEVGNYTATFTEETIRFNTGQYRLVVGISKGNESIEYIDNEIFIVFSDVVEQQEESVVNNKNGIIGNQMKINIKKQTNV